MFTMGITPSDEASASTKATFNRAGKFKDVAPKKKAKKKKKK